jgi:hypothetical protein
MRSLGLVIAGLLTLAACGASSSDDTGAGASTPTTETATVVVAVTVTAPAPTTSPPTHAPKPKPTHTAPPSPEPGATVHIRCEDNNYNTHSYRTYRDAWPHHYEDCSLDSTASGTPNALEALALKRRLAPTGRSAT